MREIDHAHHAEDQIETARHQRVDAAEQDAADQEIRYRHERARRPVRCRRAMRGLAAITLGASARHGSSLERQIDFVQTSTEDFTWRQG